MPKINKEEYEKIKLLPDYDWNWIAREKTGKILSFTNKPTKTDEVWKDKQTRLWFNYKDSQLFHFIQWEDREPYNIAELIREYEGEKIEVKNIEWLKEEVLGLRNNGNGKTNQTAVEREIGRLQEWAWNNCVDRVYELINRLDEPEVLSQKWIDDNSVNASHDGMTDEYVHVSDLENLLVPTISEMETVDITEGQIMDWLDDNDFYHHATAETVLANAVDKGELGYYGTKYSVVKKPVIPKYVAEWWGTSDYVCLYGGTRCRKEYKFDLISLFQDQGLEDYLWKVEDWIDNNKADFINIVNGKSYEVEEEPKYHALMKGHELVHDYDIYWNYDKSNHDVFVSRLHPPLDNFTTEMSKAEWNKRGINESNADFVKVEEEE